MFRGLQHITDLVLLNKTSLAGLAVCFWLTRRVGRNMKELEQNTQDKKLFDPLKAKA